jgi:dTDP-4-dehydrorhamnose 3,5-epimerase
MSAEEIEEFEGVRIISVKSVSDERGTFLKFYPNQEIRDPLDSVAISINPKVATVRGLHFQVEPHAEEKLISCIQGSIFDVIVDLRPNSKTFGNWKSFELSAANNLQIYLPKGFAHGFQTLLPDSIIHYSLTSAYSPESSYSINPFGDLQIDWPLETQVISSRDRDGISFEVGAQKYADPLRD